MGWMLRFYRDPEFDEACKAVHQFVDKVVRKALDKSNDRVATNASDRNGECKGALVIEMAKFIQDPVELRNQLINVLSAGRDTTASLLSNTFHVLARRQDIWKSLQMEVDQLRGEIPSYNDLKEMKYLGYVINECEYPSTVVVPIH